MQKAQILIIEDGRTQREMLREFLVGEGFQVSVAQNGKQAIEQIRMIFFDLILLDYKLPDMDGTRVLKEIKALNPEIDVIIMTAFGTIETAVSAMKSGAADYIKKPIDLDELLLIIEKNSERRVLLKENKVLREELLGKSITADHIIYQSPVMSELINLAGRVARSNTTILIQGESGTGKELFARLIHTLSPRSKGPFITVNCGALPENLLESELFGHEKGAFTDASQRRIGRFEEANNGSLFLDEIGEFSPAVQVKLLRFLQEREFQRVGGNQTIYSDVRIISATNRNLEESVKKRAFREDLYYRLNVVAMTLPPLRDRKQDLSPLLGHFLKHFAASMNRQIDGISPEAKDLLLKYDYPGNVRELENILERAVVITRGSIITQKDLPFSMHPNNREVDGHPPTGKLKDAVETLEKTMLKNALKKTQNHQTHAADILGISERMLRYKLKKYNLK